MKTKEIVIDCRSKEQKREELKMKVKKYWGFGVALFTGIAIGITKVIKKN